MATSRERRLALELASRERAFASTRAPRAALRAADIALHLGLGRRAFELMCAAARIHEQDGYLLKALAVWKQAARLDPGDPEVATSLFRLGAKLARLLEEA